MRQIIIAAFALACFAVSALCQEPEKPAAGVAEPTFAIKTRCVIGEPLLLKISQSRDGKISVDGLPKPLPLKMTGKTEFVDTYKSISEGGVFAGERKIVLAHVDFGGKPEDPPLQGRRIECKVGGGKQSITFLDPNSVDDESKTTLVELVPSFGAFLSFETPKGVGETFNAALRDLLALLLLAPGELGEVKAQLTLSSVDAQTSVAKLDGNIKAQYPLGTGAESVDVTLTGKIEILFDLNAMRILSAELSGQSEGTGIIQGRVATLEFKEKHRLEVKTGSLASSALAASPKIRQVERTGELSPLSGKLPSSWHRMPAVDNRDVFRCSEFEEPCEIHFRAYPSEDPSALAKGVVEQIRGDDRSIKVSEGRTKLGKTSTLQLLRGEETREISVIQTKTHVCLVIAIAPPAHAQKIRAAAKDFMKTLSLQDAP